MEKTPKAITLSVLIAAVILTVLVVKRIEEPRVFKNFVLEKRSQIDLFMEQSPDSPFSTEQRSSFQGLSYFTPDPAFRVTAQLVPIDGQQELVVPTSDGTIRRYLRYAWAEFELEGSAHSLLLLKDQDSSVSNRLFLAFRDQTSGKETYGGGRYIDLFQQRENRIIIDFNRAYNPYCVYNYTYSCPLPPAENYLAIQILAGEKMYPQVQ